MAPTVSIETITIVRPLKVIAFICGVISVLLMLLTITSSSWLQSAGFSQGLFEHCVSSTAETPLPYGVQFGEDKDGNIIDACFKVRDESYILASAALCVICLLLALLGTVLTCFGLKSDHLGTKAKYYRLAVYVMTAALIAVLISLILYPVSFAQELHEGNRNVWEFGWAYGVGWGTAIFLFGGLILLLCDQEEEEIYYKERTIIHAENDSRA